MCLVYKIITINAKPCSQVYTAACAPTWHNCVISFADVPFCLALVPFRIVPLSPAIDMSRGQNELVSHDTGQLVSPLVLVAKT